MVLKFYAEVVIKHVKLVSLFCKLNLYLYLNL